MAGMFPAHVDWLEPAYQEPLSKLQIQSGKVQVSGGVYGLKLGAEYDVLTGADAAWVLGTLWQNLPDPAIGAQIFKRGTAPFDGSRAVLVSY